MAFSQMGNTDYLSGDERCYESGRELRSPLVTPLYWCPLHPIVTDGMKLRAPNDTLRRRSFDLIRTAAHAKASLVGYHVRQDRLLVGLDFFKRVGRRCLR